MSDHAHDGNPHEYVPHVTSLETYLKVFGTLIFLTFVTVGVSLADLGPLSLPVALLVAGTKAFFVGYFFMHLKHEERFNTFFFISSGLFLCILMFMTFADIAARDALYTNEANGSVFRSESAKRTRALNEAKAAALQKAAEANAAKKAPVVAPTPAPKADPKNTPAPGGKPGVKPTPILKHTGANPGGVMKGPGGVMKGPGGVMKGPGGAMKGPDAKPRGIILPRTPSSAKPGVKPSPVVIPVLPSGAKPDASK